MIHDFIRPSKIPVPKEITNRNEDNRKPKTPRTLKYMYKDNPKHPVAKFIRINPIFGVLYASSSSSVS